MVKATPGFNDFIWVLKAVQEFGLICRKGQYYNFES